MPPKDLKTKNKKLSQTVCLWGPRLQVVDAFLKVPGAKIFTVTKHKVTFHKIDAGPPDSENTAPKTEAGGTTGQSESEKHSEEPSAERPSSSGPVESNQDGASVAEDTETFKPDQAAGGDAEPENDSSTVQGTGSESGSSPPPPPPPGKKITVRAVTELERLVFLSRERILVLACPDGPTSPGLVKSNHHLTELQKMTFLRKDPTLVTLHYLAGVGEEEMQDVAAAAKTKRNVYRFDLDDKEAFIRVIRGALQRFQA